MKTHEAGLQRQPTARSRGDADKLLESSVREAAQTGKINFPLDRQIPGGVALGIFPIRVQGGLKRWIEAALFGDRPYPLDDLKMIPSNSGGQGR